MIRPLLTIPILALLLVLPALAGPLYPDEMIKLPSGHSVKILSLSRIESSDGVTALMIRYQTPLSIDQHKALSDEVDDVWRIAIKDVERGGYHEAIISSNEVPKGIIFHTSRMMEFVYDKNADGKWVRLSQPDFVASE
jgi:hypothetical protein